MIMSGGNRFPFTASQWQELEHQALIYKYMVSGIPIPPDLLFTIKRSGCLDSSLSSKLFPRQPPHFSWSCFQMGLGRKIDPEPGRCRRTDGKKWRCSKEAYPDSKYCEKHMHRGKNRSRKPVEVATQSTTAPTVSSITRNHSNNSLLATSPHSLSLLSPETHHQNHLHYPAPAGYHAHPNHQFLSSSRPLGIGRMSPRENPTHLLLDSGGSSLANTDYKSVLQKNRNAYGLKEEVDEHAFFSEPSGSMRSLSGSSLDDAWQLTPLTMNSSPSTTNSSKQRSLSSLHNEYSYLQLQSLSDHDTPKQQKQYQHNYLLGSSDVDSLGPTKMEKEKSQKTVHRFFDELPPKDKDSWLDLDDKSSKSASVSATGLSISIPSSHDFLPIFSSRTNNDG
ncbi:growth-regulating factor 1 isoform X1 [Populus alba x Populus x berolinensis]|nr:growth-regulating factor 1 isoform X1 [Populus alba x Populus x berolinensis]